MHEVMSLLQKLPCEDYTKKQVDNLLVEEYKRRFSIVNEIELKPKIAIDYLKNLNNKEIHSIYRD